MRLNCILILSIFISLSGCKNEAPKIEKTTSKTEIDWQGHWIAPQDQSDTLNAWTVYRKDFNLASEIDDTLISQIAVDSKYWLWVNGKLIVRNGGLKRGPTPNDTYFDNVKISSLSKGDNSIVLLVNYFGKDGFSHNDSGQNGMLFNVVEKNIKIVSDSTWKSWPHPSFGETSAPHPNYRLPESNLLFDASKGDFSFSEPNFATDEFPNAVVISKANKTPYGKLVKRPIPHWKDFGLKNYETEFPEIATGDTLRLKLPYNAQVSPYLRIEAKVGDTIDIRTDHYRGGGPPNVRVQYVAKDGEQEFEVLGWMNGHNIHYHIPKGIKILDLKYRETGYNTEFSGSFDCNDPFYNRLWQKALRTLYITMRDTYMDCPDRERAQWWGDVVLESGESFYALDRKSDALTKKGILELLNWQRADSTIFSPVPAGNWDKELPGQMLASVGYYGVYNYYLHTGDLETIKEVYEPVKKYLNVWKFNENGTVKVRQGGWIWGDWGDNKDVQLLMNTQYHLAQKGLMKMAEALGQTTEVDSIKKEMVQFKKAFNVTFWQGDHYRSKNYKGATDDRSQALAVVSGLADADKFEAIFKVLQTEKHASPYMEKYVCEALFQMGQPEFALQRLKERFAKMVNHPEITTLWEGWGIGKEGFGGGTINHAWSGGGLTLLSQYVAGVYPTSAAYSIFNIQPQLGDLTHVSATVPSIKGNILVNYKKKSESLEIQIEIPSNTIAKFYLPNDYDQLENTDGKIILKTDKDDQFVELNSGTHKFNAILK